MGDNLVFLETDPLFRLVLSAVNSDRMDGASFVVIHEIEKPDGSINFTPSSFGRTAAAVYRMVMLEACRVPRRFWPEWKDINVGHVQRILGQVVPLTENEFMAKVYCNHYDSLFPNFYVEKLADDGVWKIDGELQIREKTKRMVVFHDNFQRVSQISTTIRISRPAKNTISGYVEVIYSHGVITNIEGDLYKLQLLCTCRSPIQHVREEEEEEPEEGKEDEEEEDEIRRQLERIGI